jgi:hypothetical protein
MDAAVELAEFEAREAAELNKRRKVQADRSAVGMDKVWYNCEDDYLD